MSQSQTIGEQGKQQLVLAEKQAEDVVTQVQEGQVDTVDTNARWLAFLARFRPIAAQAGRYTAYTSDVGEAARPIVAPRVVTAAYGISVAYVVGDTAYEGYKASLRAKEFAPDSQAAVVGLNVAKRAIFQGTASMLFPSLTIHSIVKYSGRYINKSNIKSLFVRRWGASLLGLSFIPALPFLFDEPVEHVVDKAFDYLEEQIYPDPLSPVRMALRSNTPHPEFAAESKKDV